MAIAGRELGKTIPTFEIMMYRSVIGFFIVVSIGLYSGALNSIKFENISSHIGRNIAHFTGQNLWFFAVTVAPLAHVIALEFTFPLWVILLSPIFLGEALTKLRLLTGVLGFLGVLVITTPWSQELSYGIIAAALSAIGFAGSVLFTKHLTKFESTIHILFFMTFIQIIFGFICSAHDGEITGLGLADMPFIIVIGVSGLLAHYCLTTALTLVPAAVVSPLEFIRLPIIAALGFVIYSEPIELTLIIGALLIFVSNYANILSETKSLKPDK
jgi:drug/metabolite transporter (DMT)-like permease